jgi:hypothetical protein
MTQKNVDKIKKKIAALLAKAQGTNNAHEALAFTEKAHDMLREHQLEIGDLAEKDPLNITTIWRGPKTHKNWHLLIPSIVAKYYGCKAVKIPDRDATHLIAVGRESARITCSMMVPFIVDQLRRLADQLSKETNFSLGKCMQLVCDNFVIRVQNYLAAQDAVEHAKGGSRELALIDEAAQWFAEQGNDLRDGKQVRLQADARARELADQVALNMQIGGGDGSKDTKLLATS